MGQMIFFHQNYELFIDFRLITQRIKLYPKFSLITVRHARKLLDCTVSY